MNFKEKWNDLKKQKDIVFTVFFMLLLGYGIGIFSEHYTEWFPGLSQSGMNGLEPAGSSRVYVKIEELSELEKRSGIPSLDELQEEALTAKEVSEAKNGSTAGGALISTGGSTGGDALISKEGSAVSDSDGMTWWEYYERLAYVRSYLLDLKKKDESCPLIDAPGTSGIRIGSYPIELFMISMAGETSGGAIIIGDKGRGYGLCQFDYRYDLVDFINWAYERNPVLWIGFRDLYGKYEPRDPELINHEGVLRGFRIAEYLSRTDYALDQLEFMYRDYFENTFRQMELAGFSLEKRHIAVSAAILSININCGPKTSLYLKELSPKMSDEEMLNRLYELRNSVMKKNGKGTNKRYLVGEPQLALDLLHGEVNVLSDLSYMGGVSWGAQARSYLGELLSEEEIRKRMDAMGPGMIGVSGDSNVSGWSELMNHMKSYEGESSDTESTDEWLNYTEEDIKKLLEQREQAEREQRKQEEKERRERAMKEIVLEDTQEETIPAVQRNAVNAVSEIFLEDDPKTQENVDIENPKLQTDSAGTSEVSEIILED